MASGNIRWVPPLPEGWEAKYDATQKRYFFIDHRTKVTSWNDPRFSQPPAPVAPVAPVARPVTPQQPQSQRYGYGGFQQQQQQTAQQQQQQRQQLPQQSAARSSHQQAPMMPTKNMVQDYMSSRQGAYGTAQASPQRLSQQQQHAKHHYVDDESDEEEDDAFNFHEDLPELEVDESAIKTLRDQYPTCPAGKIRMLLERNLNSIRNTELDIEAMGFEKVVPKTVVSVEDAAINIHKAAVLRISKFFPAAMGTIVQDIYNETYQDEAKTKANLRMMGYHEGSGEQKSATPERHRDAAADERDRKRATSPKRPVSPRTNLSAAEKSELVTKLCQEFPNLDRSIVQLALETAEDKEDKARRMLSFMYADQPALSPKQTSPGKQAASSSTSPARSTGSSNYAQLTNYKVPTTSSNYTRPSTSGGAERTRVTSPPRPTNADQRPRPSDTGAQNKQQGDYLDQTSSYDVLGILDGCCPQPLGKTDTDFDQSEASATKVYVGKKRVVTSQQQVFRTERQLRETPQQVFTSSIRTPAMGQDQSLAKGADLNHVERYGAVTMGPNKELAHGPNKSFVHGSQGAIGADSSLRRGPQADLRRGPQPDLCRGPAYLVSANKVLVTSI